jgi:hypothetical protein
LLSSLAEVFPTALSIPFSDWAMHVPDRQDWELVKSVRVSERGEQALSELPGAVRSLSEKLPTLLSVARGARS